MPVNGSARGNARGQAQNWSRGKGLRGSGRQGASSSSKFSDASPPQPPNSVRKPHNQNRPGPAANNSYSISLLGREPSGRTRGSRGRGRGNAFRANIRNPPTSTYSKNTVETVDLTIDDDSTTDPKSSTNTNTNPFESERLANAAKRAQRENTSLSRGRGGGSLRGRGKTTTQLNPKQVRFDDSPSPPDSPPDSPVEETMNPFASASSTASSNPFDNAKKQASVFGAPSAAAVNPFAAKQDAPAKSNPFGAPGPATMTPNTSIFGAPSTTPNGTPPYNPFGAVSQPSSTKAATNVFGQPSSASNGTPPPTFGAPTKPANNPFGKVSGASNGGPSNGKPPPTFGASSTKPAHNSFGKPSGASNGGTSNGKPPPTFGAPSTKPANNSFGKPSGASNGGTSNGKPPPAFGAPSAKSASNPFGKPSAGTFGATPASSPFGVESNKHTTKPASKPAHNSFAAASKPHPASSKTGFGASTGFGSSKPSSLSSSSSTPNNAFSMTVTNGSAQKSLFSNPPVHAAPAKKRIENSVWRKLIYGALREAGITPPTWPAYHPHDPGFKAAIEGYWRASKVHRSEIRVCLIKANYFDAPGVRKDLEFAIDFKGICETMCPDFECTTRIYERDWVKEETENGVVVPRKMLKKMTRSAAGQESPLPMDIRSPGCLRRTVDYLLKSVLGDDEDNLPKVHLFLWDRTRAIRRDFVFQSMGRTSQDILDEVYCFERIIRFHIISLHQMSKEGVAAGEFSEQQEKEQLAKAMLSLITLYDKDCVTQNITCENESEFRAYDALLNAGSSGTLDTVQNLSWKQFRDSDEIQIAISLVEALQNSWDPLGPLTPQSATDIAPNAFAKFFTILEDKQVSYTMACFAEIHFNYVRKSILKTILISYRKQRDQTKDWTLSKLNAFLRFDDENEIIDFGEKYGLRFDEVDGESILSFESDKAMRDPHPPVKHAHSYNLVERKRGNHTLPEAMEMTVFDETPEADAGEEEEGLFVTDGTSQPKAPVLPKFADAPATTTITTTQTFPSFSPSTSSPTEDTKVNAATPPASTLNNATLSPKLFGDLFSQKPTSAVGVVSEASSSTASQPSLFAPKPLDSPSNSTSTSSSFFSKPLESTSNTASTSNALFAKPLDSPASPGTSANLQSKLTPSVSTFNMNADAAGKGSSIPTNTTNPSSVFGFAAPKPTAPSAVDAPAPQTFGSTLTGAPQTEIPKAPSFFPAPPKPKTPSATGLGISSQITGQKGFPPLGQAQPFTPKVSSPLSGPPLSLPAQVPPNEVPSSVVQPSVTSQPSASLNLGLGNQEPSSSNALSVVQQPHPYGREAQLNGLTNWMALGEDGIIDQFVSYNVEEILMQAAQIFQQEQAQRKELEKNDSDRVEADAFRYSFIATKYFNQWRTVAYKLMLQRRGREARRARAESARARADRDIVEELMASARSGGARLRDSMEEIRRESMNSMGDMGSLIGATGILDGVHDPDKRIRSIVREEGEMNVKKRRRPEKATEPNWNMNQHKRGKSENPSQRSLFDKSEYLAGDSRTLRMSKYGPTKDEGRQQSGVQSNYFRMKALGVHMPPNVTSAATALVNQHVVEQRHSYEKFSAKNRAYEQLEREQLIREQTPKQLKHKRSYEAFATPQTRRGSRLSASMAHSVPNKSYLDPDFSLSIEGDEHTKALKRRAQAVMNADARARRKRSFTNDDEEAIFAQAKRIREQMDEGVEFYREERRRLSASQTPENRRGRSVSG